MSELSSKVFLPVLALLDESETLIKGRIDYGTESCLKMRGYILLNIGKQYYASALSN